MLETLQHEFLLQAGIIDLDKSLLIVLGIFLVFWMALDVLVVRPMRGAQEKRFARMEGARQDAEKMDLRAAEANSSYKERLSAARAEALAIREELASEAEGKAATMLATVRKEADSSLAAGRDVLHQSAGKAREDLQPRIEELANLIADRILVDGGAR